MLPTAPKSQVLRIHIHAFCAIPGEIVIRCFAVVTMGLNFARPYCISCTSQQFGNPFLSIFQEFPLDLLLLRSVVDLTAPVL